MLIDQLLIDCPEVGTDKLVRMVKEKETYRFTNLISSPGTYSVIRKSCNINDSGSTGNITANGSFVFTPEREGVFTITFDIIDTATDNTRKRQTIIFTHYPTIIKSIIKNTKSSLCNCDCGCDDCDDGKHCLESQSLFGETQLLLGLYKTIPTCEGKDPIKLFLSLVMDLYTCDLVSLFCDKELQLKLSGSFDFSSRLSNKIVAINYLALYYYELWITNPLPEFVKYVNDKYNYRAIKDCLLQAGIDIFAVQTIWDQITAPCDDEPETCSIGCFGNVEEPTLFEYTFMVNTQLNGIYHTATLLNSCQEEMFFDRLIYKDDQFEVQIRNKSGVNPASVLPGATLDVDVKFIGTKSLPSVLNIPYKIQGTLINTYKITFASPETPNTPPVIVDIFKELDNRDPYTFTVADFEDHFTDADGDILERIVIVGDVSRFKLNGQPYLSGSEINRNNITSLVYTPLDTDDIYQVLLSWMAYDSYGLPSN